MNAAVFQKLLLERPHLFSSYTVCVSAAELAAMQQIIAAIETVVQLPAYQEMVLSQAPEIARYNPGIPGLFLGYDFHITPDGPKLIEINTNAGGVALVAWRYEKNLAHVLCEMFLAEWKLQRENQPLKRIAIVDHEPEKQFLFPEFVLFQAWFQERGIDAVIVDPSALSMRDHKIFYQNQTIDLIYNRLTDFSLSEPQHKILREAYLSNAVVLTPHPRAHALYADKRNLCILSDAKILAALGVQQKIIATLENGIPKTQIVQPQHAEFLWQHRKKLFFKPIAGYGSKGVYRGEGITRKVFNEILENNYIAQDFIPPGTSHTSAIPKALKYDIRNFVYNQKVFAVIARTYQGQVTNFRTEGGGFAKAVV